jgi:excisionase family DNA binding protein
MELMNVQRTATHLGITPGTLYRWAAKRRVPCVKVGDRLLFEAGAIRQWIALRVKSEQSLRERRRRERRPAEGGNIPHPPLNSDEGR